MVYELVFSLTGGKGKASSVATLGSNQHSKEKHENNLIDVLATASKTSGTRGVLLTT